MWGITDLSLDYSPFSTTWPRKPEHSHQRAGWGSSPWPVLVTLSETMLFLLISSHSVKSQLFQAVLNRDQYCSHVCFVNLSRIFSWPWSHVSYLLIILLLILIKHASQSLCHAQWHGEERYDCHSIFPPLVIPSCFLLPRVASVLSQLLASALLASATF